MAYASDIVDVDKLVKEQLMREQELPEKELDLDALVLQQLMKEGLAKDYTATKFEPSTITKLSVKLEKELSFCHENEAKEKLDAIWKSIPVEESAENIDASKLNQVHENNLQKFDNFFEGDYFFFRIHIVCTT